MNPRDIAALRGRARTRAIHDEGLSLGARVLYFFLDDEARAAGKTPLLTQSQMAGVIGASVRSVRDWMAELEERRYVVESRHSHGSVVALNWTLTGTQNRPAKSADQVGGDRQNLPIRAAKSADHHLIRAVNYISEDERTQATEAESSQEEIVAGVQVWLREYPGAVALAGTPDAAIARQCLDAVDWDTVALGQLLVWLHRTKRARPSRTWAWFPAVLRASFQRADAG